ncbi:MAG: hypothetical protein EBZ95_04825 [Chitinophagia bacterium]|nr:hypothetical protein [Chitinophagia bacterium]
MRDNNMAENNVPKFEDTTPIWEETSAVEKIPNEKKPKDNQEPYETFGSDIMQTGADILHGIGTALDYPVAPMRSILAGKNPLIPLIKGPSTAPTSEEVLSQIPALKETTIPVAAENLFKIPDFTKGFSSPEELKKALEYKTEEQSIAQTLAPVLDIGLGAGAFKSVGLLGKGVGAAGKAVVPEMMQEAYTKGKEGVKAFDKDFLEKMNRQVLKAGEEISEPIIQQQATQRAINVKNINDLENQINVEKSNLQKAIDDSDDVAAKSHQAKVNQLESDIFGLKAQHKEQLNIDKVVNEKKIADLKNELKNENEKLDTAVKNQKLEAQKIHEDKINKLESDIFGLKAESDEILSLAELGINDPKTVNAITKELRLYYGDNSIQGFNNLKRALNNLSSHARPEIGRLAKIGYKNLRELQLSELSKTDSELAKTISDTNKRWSSMYDLEDVLSPIEKTNLDVSKTLKAIKAEEGSGAEELARQRQLRTILPTFDPEQSAKVIQEMEEMGKKTSAIEGFKPQVGKELPPEILDLESKLKMAKEASKKAKVPEYTDLQLYQKQQELDALKRAGPQVMGSPANERIAQLENELQKALEYKAPEYTDLNLYQKQQELEALKSTKPLKTVQPTSPELERLEKLVSEAKGKGVENVPGLERFNLSSPQAVQDTIADLIEKMSQGTDKVGVQRKLDDLFKYIEQNQGLQAAESTKKYMIQTAKDKALATVAQKGGEVQTIPTSLKEFGEKVAGKGIGAARWTGSVVKTVQDVMRFGTKKLASSTPEELQAFGQKMIQTDPAAAPYTKILNEAAGKNQTSRNAIIFGLMQQPAFRNIYKKTEGISDEESGK